MHNIYKQNELSKETINKINNFLKKLIDIKEIKENYKKTIELSEIDLKEYEASIKKFEPIIQKNEQGKMEILSSSSEEFNSEGEKEETIKKEGKEEGKKDEEKEEEKEEEKREEKEEKEIEEEKEEEREKEEEEKGEEIEEKEIEEEIKEEVKENEEKEKEEEKEEKKKKKEESVKKEEKDTKKEDIKKKIIFFDNQTLKIKSSKDILPISFTNISEDDFSTKSLNNIKKIKDNNIKKEKNEERDEKIGKGKPYEFDILKYKTQDIASELARVNYALFSKIKVEEFLKGSFNKKDKYKLSPNICQIIKR